MYVRVSSMGPEADWMFQCESNPDVVSMTNLKKPSYLHPNYPDNTVKAAPTPLKSGCIL